MSCYTIAILNFLVRSVQVSTQRLAWCFSTSSVYWVLWMGGGLCKYCIYLLFCSAPSFRPWCAILLSARGIQDWLLPSYQMFHSPSHVRVVRMNSDISFSWKLKFTHKKWTGLDENPSEYTTCNMLWTQSLLLEMCWVTEHAYCHRKERTPQCKCSPLPETGVATVQGHCSGAAWSGPQVCVGQFKPKVFSLEPQSRKVT